MNGLRSGVRDGTSKRRKIFTWLKKMKYDIHLLQETNSTSRDANLWLNEWGGEGVFAHGDERSRGVGILVKPGSGIVLSETHADPNGRFITTEVQLNNISVTIGNMYGPNDDSRSVFDDFFTKVSEYGNELMIIGGDFNTCMNIEDRVSHARGRVRNNDRCKEAVKYFAQKHNLIDLWRELNPTAQEFTYHRKTPTSKSRIDYFLVSQSFLRLGNEAESSIRDRYLSDHRLVTCRLTISQTKFGKSYWKFNNSLLSDENFVSFIQGRIGEILLDNDDSSVSACLLFETLLCVLRGDIIAFASSKKRKKQNELAEIEKEINTRREDGSEENVEADLEQLLEARDRMVTQEAKDNAFRSKCRWKHMGERGTKYFHGLPKRNVARTTQSEMFVSCPESENGLKLSNDSSEMLGNCRLYFEGLYQRDGTVTGMFNSDVPISLPPGYRQP